MSTTDYKTRAGRDRALAAAAMQLARLTAPSFFPSFLVYQDEAYRMQWFHRVIAERLQDVADGITDRLMVFMPPQHGKSELVSRKFPAWLLGRSPNTKIACCSYSSTLATGFARQVQRIMQGEQYGRIFPTGALGARAKAGRKLTADYFDTNAGTGFYKAVGVCGSLTGTPIDLGIIDDPVKDALEAGSPTYRDRVWQWYTDVFLTRLHNRSRQIIIMTRWHEDDLAGRLLQREADRWTVLTIPAIKETAATTADPRQPGDALWPERHSKDRLLEVEARSPRTFAALYQQRPTIDGGNIVKREWFKTITAADAWRQTQGQPVEFFLDTAYTDRTEDDPSGIIATAKADGNVYVLHAQKVRMKFPDLLRFLPQYVKAHGYSPRSTIRIEPKANGLSVIDQLRATTSLNVVATPSPKDSKETRLFAASPAVESGRVVLAEGPWNEEFTDEVCGFPAKPHDEYVDVLCYAINHHLNNPYRPIDKGRTSQIIY